MTGSALLRSVNSIAVSDMLDIALVAFFLYLLLLWFEWTKAAFIARGILILGGLYVLARQLGMVLTTWLFHGFFAILLIALVIIFQEEFRRFFERLALWRWGQNGNSPFEPEDAAVLARSMTTHARAHIGALVVLRGRDPLERHVEGGHELNGRLSGPLLQSIFDPHSDGHDGAIWIERGKVRKFAVHLPLSKNFDRLQGRGTRHAAALGLSEVCDALCIVVSEQKGTISVAQRGEWMEVASEEALERLLVDYGMSKRESSHNRGWRSLFMHKRTEKILAVGTAFALWLIFVQGFKPETESFMVPVQISNIPDNLRVRAYTPRRVSLIVSGLKRDLDFVTPGRLRVYVSLEGQGAGVDRVMISEENVRVPNNVRFIAADPPAVEVNLTPEIRS